MQKVYFSVKLLLLLLGSTNNYNLTFSYFQFFSALKLDHKIGNFESGKEFDAILIQMDHENQSLEDRLQKFINTGDDRMIKHVYVAGKQRL